MRDTPNPLPVTRTPHSLVSMRGLAGGQGYLGFDSNGRLHVIGADSANYQRLLDTVNGELEMPRVVLTGAEFYGDTLGAELFFEYPDLDRNSAAIFYDTQIYRDGELIATVDDYGSYLDRTARKGNQYTYALKPIHIDGQSGDFSNEVPPDTSGKPGDNVQHEREHGPTGLRAGIYWFDIELFWDRNESGNVEYYEIRRNGEFVASTGELPGIMTLRKVAWTMSMMSSL